MTTESRSSCNGSRDRLGLSFTIDYLLFNRVKGSKEEATESHAAEQTENNVQNHQNPKLEKVRINREKQGNGQQQSEAETENSKASKEEGDEEQRGEEVEEVTTTTTSSSLEKSTNKPNHSYIALISKAILASEEKKLLLCDIYQWIMDHYPYFKSKDKNWRNSVRHNLSLNDCFIKAGRSDNGKGHYWAIHPANYQDFSKGDYQCRRARRRVRRMAGQLRLRSLTSSYHPITIPNRTTCWCCPQVPALSCLMPRLYWPWSSIQPQVGLHLSLNASVP
ncbi:forkhead box Q2 [Odontesthes bonariensis]|uniref:forkhead box Q2 n=1 Tax=Odontesthes bonariensis TaxID=219752 RepID=UPI003F58821F